MRLTRKLLTIETGRPRAGRLGHPMVTKQSVEALGRAPGSPVTVSFKASAAHLLVREPSAPLPWAPAMHRAR
jgi:hypothetical protein